MESGLYIVGVGLGAVWGWNGCRVGTGLRTFICADAVVFSPDIGPFSHEGTCDRVVILYIDRVT